ncbi:MULTISPECIES: Cof-type HAD-IIB family hydrolase [unclassified Enterococcus]|uniref:Cof-type HAD-IIB family hydrolase n=1 Tax=unclassified Enterococcus TaxID=2608891 RepID=UPI001CE10632|nr:MULTISPECIES: Cof-type HAD-IIB family hydrolase [unclassified Enterococcus]MCA5012924.1 Cof-type HAD-IIB family hydrolase [Enterococcus sp. S23]MCA5016175.1 Cof-type HAD-IIB family hydrolase [Enterococcus sp. S22(2020)]
MEKIQAVAFFDLDGTLLNEKSEITSEISTAIQALKDNHVLPLIATGRTIVEIEHIMKDSGIDSAIVMNGQLIQVEGKNVYSNEFTPEEVAKMQKHVKQQGHEISYYNDRHIWCSGHNEIVSNAYAFIHSKPPMIDPFNTENKTVNMMLVLSEDGDEHYLEHFPEMTFYRNGPYSIDTVRKGVSKGSGVQNLFKSLDLPKVPTFAFGDGINDLALFDACDNKIAMGNARAELKERSSYITKKNTDGGIVHALKHFDLI